MKPFPKRPEVAAAIVSYNTAALTRSAGPWILLLNSDARLRDPGDLARLVERLETEPGVGVSGPRLESPQGRLEYSARAFPRILRELARPPGLHRLLPARIRARLLGLEFQDHSIPGDTDWLTGACLLVRRQVFDEVGGFDPAIFLFAEGLEWCWRVRNGGWRIRLEPSVTVQHMGGASGSGLCAGKRRLAAAGEAYAIRRRRGVALWSVLTGARPRRARSGSALADAKAWIAALIAGGSRHPAVVRGTARPYPRSQGPHSSSLVLGFRR